MDNAWNGARQRPGSDRRVADDEISLVDLWLALARRKWWILGTFLVIVTLAAAAAYLSVPRYQFVSTIEIGTRISAEQVSLIEAPAEVVAKLNEGYIPLVLEEFAQKSPGGLPGGAVNARVPRGSSLVVLESEAPTERAEVITALHQAVVARIQQDHNRIIDVIRQGQQVVLAEEMNRLAQYQADAKLIEARIERVDQVRELLGDEAKMIRELVARSEAERERAVAEAGEPTAAMTLLLLTNDLHQNRARLTELEERTAVGLMNERGTYISELERIRGNIESQKLRVEGVRLQLTNLQETHPLAEARQSLQPTAPNRSLMLALGAVLGLVAGLFVAFFAELGASVRARRIQGEEPPHSLSLEAPYEGIERRGFGSRRTSHG